jgi:phosphate transport system permease protein
MDHTIIVRQRKNILFQRAVIAFSAFSVLPLFFILLHIFWNGISVINWQFLVGLPKPTGETGGGIANALAGTLMLVTISGILAIPIGIASGIYLAEHQDDRLAYYSRSCVEVLQGIPSIVIGIVAYMWIVTPFGGFSALSGGVALAVMMLPIIVRSTEETLKLIPFSLKEAALALGVPYYKTILKVIVPAGMSGIVTGVLLSIARVAGETAPLLFTAFGNPFLNLNIFKPVNSLPLMIFNYAASPYQDWHAIAWGASLVLVVSVLLLNITAKLVIGKFKVNL